jgi:hypothetical protein
MCPCLAEWASGDLSQVVTWDYSTSAGVSYHTFQRQSQGIFSEAGEIAAWGTWYLATSSSDGVSNKSLHISTSVEYISGSTNVV